MNAVWIYNVYLSRALGPYQLNMWSLGIVLRCPAKDELSSSCVKEKHMQENKECWHKFKQMILIVSSVKWSWYSILKWYEMIIDSKIVIPISDSQLVATVILESIHKVVAGVAHRQWHLCATLASGDIIHIIS